MKINRTKNASRNILFGLAMKVIQILLPFMTRTAIIYTLGMKYLGLSSLFTSILQVLNMAELGVGSAMVFSMYKPIAVDDHSKVCSLMKLYRLYYRLIGTIIAVIGLCILPVIPKLVKGDIPSDINIYLLYLLNLGATVLSYWLFAYKNSILSAHQREDVISKIKLVMAILQNVIQLILLVTMKNYYAYVVTTLFIQALTNIVTAIIANKMFPQYKPYGKLSKEEVKQINSQIKDLFTSKLGSVIFSAADSLVISAFLGLELLAIYQNYYYIVNSIIGILQIVFTACTAGIGNSIITESQEKNFRDFNKLTFLIAWISGFCACCLLCLYQPFMELWVGKAGMLQFPFVICICVFFFIWELYRLINVYKDAAGLWHADRFRPLCSAIANLMLNIFIVNFFGIYGVMLSTIISVLLVGTPWLLHNVFTYLFPSTFKKMYIKKIIKYSFITLLAISFTYVICLLVQSSLIIVIIYRTIICCSVCNIVFLLAYRNTREFKDTVALVERISKGKISFQKK